MTKLAEVRGLSSAKTFQTSQACNVRLTIFQPYVTGVAILIFPKNRQNRALLPTRHINHKDQDHKENFSWLCLNPGVILFLSLPVVFLGWVQSSSEHRSFLQQLNCGTFSLNQSADSDTGLYWSDFGKDGDISSVWQFEIQHVWANRAQVWHYQKVTPKVLWAHAAVCASILQICGIYTARYYQLLQGREVRGEWFHMDLLPQGTFHWP